jgi:hypothetical protein
LKALVAFVSALVIVLVGHTVTSHTRGAALDGVSDLAYVRVPAAAFATSDITDATKYINRGTTLDVLCSEDAQYFVTPVEFPAGATLSSVTVLYRTDHEDASLDLDLMRVDLRLLSESGTESSGWIGTVASVGGHLDTGGVRRLETSVSKRALVEERFSYSLSIGAYCAGEWDRGDAIYVYGALVGYSFPVVVPLSFRNH